MELEGKPQHLLIIFGPPAVGKMTVGKILAEKLSYRLYYDEQVTDLADKFLSPSEVGYWPMVSKLRHTILEGVAKSYLRGFIFTYIWDLDAESDREFIDNIIDLFEDKLWKVKFIELQAKLGTRLKRSQGADRIEAKPSSAGKEQIESEIMAMQDRRHSTDESFEYEPHLKIESTNLSAEETAEMIIDHFDFEIS